MSAGWPMDIEAIAAMLADRAEELCTELLPAGIREGAEWRIGSVAGEPGRSMAVHLRGAKAGVWYDWAAGIGGDALDLAAQVLFGGDTCQGVRWARAWLGIDATDAASYAARRHEAVKKRQSAEAENTRMAGPVAATRRAPSPAGGPAPPCRPRRQSAARR
jgi:hypothetical protein